jgi:hypothetical protein
MTNNSRNSHNNHNNHNNSNNHNNNSNNNNNNSNNNNGVELTWEDMVREAHREYNNHDNDNGNGNYPTEIDYISDLEEDSDYDDVDYIKSNKFNTPPDDKNCPNDSVITLTPYDTDDDQLCIIKIQNSEGIFRNGHCFTKNELRGWINSDLNQLPTNIMSIFTKPRRKENLLNGCSGKATGRLVVRLPDNMYVTLGSADKILHNKNQIWYALPLFGGQKRRIGNLASICGAGMNHGQIPGFKIYKLFKRSEIETGIVVKEIPEDYQLSLFMTSNITPLMDILGLEDANNIDRVSTLRDTVFQRFSDGIIRNLLR